MKYISINNVSFLYDKDPVLEGVTFDIHNGEFVTLTGENGAAKSTLVKIILGILKEKTGSVFISEKNIHGNDFNVSYLPQHAVHFNSGFPTTVYEFVKSGLFRKNSWFKKFSKEDQELVKKSLDSMEIWNLKDEKIGNLSGGQKQRVILARMFMFKSDLLILDEPTTGMDEKTRNSFYKLLYSMVKESGISILMITHDSEVVEKYADKNIHLCKSENNSWCCKLNVKKEISNVRNI